MRRLIAVLALSFSLLTVAGMATADPPECGANCPWGAVGVSALP